MDTCFTACERFFQHSRYATLSDDLKSLLCSFHKVYEKFFDAYVANELLKNGDQRLSRHDRALRYCRFVYTVLDYFLDLLLRTVGAISSLPNSR